MKNYIMSREIFLNESASRTESESVLKKECVEAARWFLTEGYKKYVETAQWKYEKLKGVETKPFCTNPFADLREFKDIDTSAVLSPDEYGKRELVFGWNVIDEDGNETLASEYSLGEVLSISLKRSLDDEEDGLLMSKRDFYDTSANTVAFRLSDQLLATKLKDVNVTDEKFFFFEFNEKKRDNLFIGKAKGSSFQLEILRAFTPLVNDAEEINKELRKANIRQRFLYIEYNEE